MLCTTANCFSNAVPRLFKLLYISTNQDILVLIFTKSFNSCSVKHILKKKCNNRVHWTLLKCVHCFILSIFGREVLTQSNNDLRSNNNDLDLTPKNLIEKAKEEGIAKDLEQLSLIIT